MEDMNIENVLKENKELKLLVNDLNSKLLVADKMVILGENMSGIIHEINTPLGAVKSSSEYSLNAFCEMFDATLELSKYISNEEKNLILSLVEKIGTSKALSTKDERKIKKSLTQKFEDIGLDDCKSLAQVFVKLGVYEVDSSFDILLKNSDYKIIFNIISQIVDMKRNMQNILVAVNSANSIVQALKSYSRVGDDNGLSNITISALLETVLTLFNSKTKLGIEVVKEYKDDSSINCNPDKIIQVLTNLISNAIFAMDGKGILEIIIDEDDDHKIISIKDSGCGIPIEVQDRIFDKFFTTKPIGVGNGLGLDIVKKIIDEHDGKINFVSTQSGTEFTVFISKNL
jgi:signal transduction histidine kinase